MVAARGIVFPDVTRRNADDSFVRCFKFFINYAFYKFGLEVIDWIFESSKFYVSTWIQITCITLVINISHRMDGVAFLYALLLFCILLLERNVLARLWFLVVAFLAILLPIQYEFIDFFEISLINNIFWNFFQNAIEIIYCCKFHFFKVRLLCRLTTSSVFPVPLVHLRP